MTGAPALVAADIPERLRHDLADDVLAPARRRERTQAFVATMLKQRGDFGITRVGSITRLDRDRHAGRPGGAAAVALERRLAGQGRRSSCRPQRRL